uniref:Uncharacterized protein n=1 Tax=Megaselia scalaris TaxID=36166 RepID=T1GJ18_MEGSC
MEKGRSQYSVFKSASDFISGRYSCDSGGEIVPEDTFVEFDLILERNGSFSVIGYHNKEWIFSCDTGYHFNSTDLVIFTDNSGHVYFFDCPML